MLGWSFQSLPVIQVLPGAVPMQPNTALSFVLLAIAALLRSRALAAVAGVLAAAALAEYVGVPIDSGQWVLDVWYERETAKPGLMAPNAAGCFLLAAGAGVWRHPVANSLLGGLILAVGLAGVVGHLAGWAPSYNWGGWATSMAVHTGLGFCLVAMALLLQGDRRWGLAAAFGTAVAFWGLLVSIGTSSIPTLVFALVAAAVTAWLQFALDRARRLRRDALRAAEEARRHEVALQARSEDFKATAEILRALAASMSHDMRSPLSNIAIICSELLEEHGDTLPRDLVETMEKCILAPVDRLMDLTAVQQDLIDDLMATPQMEDVDMQEVVAASLELMHGAVHNAKADIETAPLPVVHGVRGGLQRVMNNLLENALKYRSLDKRCEIKIGHTSTPTEHIFSVADNGIGFDPERHKCIFMWRARLNAKYPGMGYGLGTVTFWTNRWGGTCRAESPGEGHGSTFYFTVPKEGAGPHD